MPEVQWFLGFGFCAADRAHDESELRLNQAIVAKSILT
jgi:hypothetical protein